MTRYLLTLLICAYVALAPAIANAGSYDGYSHDVQLMFARQDALAKRMAGTATSFDSNGVAVPVTKQTPIQVTVKTAATATTAAATETATITATQTAVKKVMPTAGQVAKGLGRSVGVGLVTLAIYDLLGKAVDYVLDPANNQVKFKESSLDGLYWVWAGVSSSSPSFANYVDTTPARACQNIAALYHTTFDHVVLTNETYAQCYGKDGYYNAVKAINYEPINRVMSYDEVAQRGIKLANNGNTSAQNSLVETVNDMSSNPTTYNIDNSYFDGGTVISDNSDEIINNYITNNYPNIANNLNKSDGTVTNADGSTSTTTTKDNGDGTSTQTTVTNNTTNNTSSTTNTTYNNTTNNITNISYVTNITNVNKPATTASTAAATSSTPSSTASLTASVTASTPASSTAPTTIELPPFCQWAKPVCDFVDWLKKDDIPPEEQPTTPESSDDIDVVGIVSRPYVSFPAYCPDNPSWTFLGGTITFPLNIVCQSFEMLKYAMLCYAYIRALAIIGGGVTSNG